MLATVPLLVILTAGPQQKTVQKRVILAMMIMDIGSSFSKINSGKDKKLTNTTSSSTTMSTLLTKVTLVLPLKNYLREQMTSIGNLEKIALSIHVMKSLLRYMNNYLVLMGLKPKTNLKIYLMRKLDIMHGRSSTKMTLPPTCPRLM